MRGGRLAVVAACVALACPAESHATHGGCRWGATLDVDPKRPDPARVGVQPAFWFCSGPVVSLHVGSSGEPAPAPAEPGPASPPPLRLTMSPRRIWAGRAARVRLRALWIGPPDGPAAGVGVRMAGRQFVTDARGSVAVRLRARRPGRITAVAGEARARLRVLRPRGRR